LGGTYSQFDEMLAGHRRGHPAPSSYDTELFQVQPLGRRPQARRSGRWRVPVPPENQILGAVQPARTPTDGRGGPGVLPGGLGRSWGALGAQGRDGYQFGIQTHWYGEYTPSP
jgi:hypothetical protein